MDTTFSIFIRKLNYDIACAYACLDSWILLVDSYSLHEYALIFRAGLLTTEQGTVLWRFWLEIMDG